MRAEEVPIRILQRPVFSFLVAMALVAVVFGPSFDGGFFGEDRATILANPLVERTAPLRVYFARPVSFYVGEALRQLPVYRPLVDRSFALDFAVHGANPIGFRLTSLLLHGIAGALVFALARRLGASLRGAFAATSVWMLLPRGAEAVASLGGRGDVMATVLAFSALLVARPGSLPRLFGAVLLALGAAFADPVGLATFVPLALGEGPWFSRPNGTRRERLENGARLAALVLAPIVYMTARATAFEGTALDPGLSLLGTTLSALEAVARYAWMLVTPLFPETTSGELGKPEPFRVAVGAALVLLAAALAVRFRRGLLGPRGRMVAFGAVAILVAAVDLPIPRDSVAVDRHTYLPTAAFAAAAAPFASELLAFVRRSWLAAGVALVAALALFVTARARCALWGDEGAFWSDAYRRAPEHVLPARELGAVYARAGLPSLAVEFYRRAQAEDDAPALRLRRDRALLPRLVHSLADAGALDEALALQETVCATLPSARAHQALATVRLQRFEWPLARGAVLQSLALAPRSVAGRTLLDEIERAERLARELDAEPAEARASADYLAGLATLHATAHRARDAVRFWLEAALAEDATVATARAAARYVVDHGGGEEAARALGRLRELAGSEREIAALERRATWRRAEQERLRALAASLPR